jgi:hypothetical protein
LKNEFKIKFPARLSALEQTPSKLIDLSALISNRPDRNIHCQRMKKNRFFSPKEFSAYLNSSHFLTLDIAMQKVECKIKPYFNYL